MKTQLSYPAILLSIAVAASIFTWSPSFIPIPGRSGFLLAGLTLAILVGYYLAYQRHWLIVNLKTHRHLCIAVAILAASKFVSVLGAYDKATALIQALRVLAVLVLFLFIFFENNRGPELKKALSITAASIIGIHAGLFILSFAIPSLFDLFFDTHIHQNTGQFPRFRGFPAAPFPFGTLMLACVGLIQPLQHRTARTLLTLVALALTVATLSFATLLVPAVLIWVIVQQKTLRILGVLAVTIAAAAILFIRPMSLQFDDKTIQLGQLQPSYAVDGKGDKYMPMQNFTFSNVQFDYHLTAYYYLAQRSLLCFIENPYTGVGGRNHPISCPVKTMNTWGGWSSGRIAHNEYTGLFAEYGATGVVATILLLAVLFFKYRFQSEDVWVQGIVITYLIIGLAGEVWYQFPFAALIATSIGQMRTPSR